MLRWSFVILLALIASAGAQSVHTSVNGQLCFLDAGSVSCGDPGLSYVKGNSGTTSALTAAGTITALNSTVTGTLKATNLGTDSALTTATVCVVTATGQLYFGSGSGGVCAGTSSLRFKRDITPMAYGLDDLLKLRPVAFNYREGYGDNGVRRQVGLLAEDVVKVMPGLVQRDAQDRPNSIDYNALVPVLIAAIKQQEARIHQLEQRSLVRTAQ